MPPISISLPARDHPVMLETGALLAERRKQQGVFVPFGDGGMEAGRDDNFAAESRFQRRISANVVRVGVSIH
jgi:hypothetical protein